MLKLTEKVYYLLFVILVFAISLITFWKAFSFDFWGEDWEQLWFATYDPVMINNPSEMQHPIVIYEELLLINFFGTNPFYWQVTGFLLKVLSAFAVGLMVLAITKSKRAAFFTGVIFASMVGGLGSMTWVAAHASALIIPILCLGVYLYFLKRGFILALIVLLISVISDPARGLFGVFILVFWEILSILQNAKRFTESFKRIFILIGSVIVLFIILNHFWYSGTVSVISNIQTVIARPVQSLSNFLTIIGNLLVGWIISIPQDAFVFSKNNIYGLIAGYLFFIYTIFLVARFFKRKDEYTKTLLIFSIWIPFFFLPNWLLSSQEMIGYGWVLGTTHRYLTLSAVGFACLLGIVIALIKNNYLGIAVLSIVIGSNIIMANRILGDEWVYRSTTITSKIWDKIDKDIPAHEKNSLLTFQGEDKTRLIQLSQAKIAFGFRRDVRNFNELPKSTVDPQLVKALLCGQEIGTPKISLSHLHVWEVVNNTVVNISEKARKEYSDLNCDKR